MRIKGILFGLTIAIAGQAGAVELWVANYFGNNVKRFDIDTGVEVGSINGILGPLGMTYGPGNKVYIAAENSNSIRTFSPTGADLGNFATVGMNAPTAIAFKGGAAFVANFNANSVTQYDLGGNFTGTFVTGGSGVMNGPDIGMTFGPDGNLYVPSFWNHRIQKYNGTTGAYLGDFVTAGSGGLTQPRQILWRDGLAYVTSDNGSKVLRYNGTTGAFVDTFVTAGSGGLNSASGMLFYGNSLFIASGRNHRVLRYDAATGAFQGAFITSGLNGPVTLLVVPEPTTLVMIATGMAMVARRIRRK